MRDNEKRKALACLLSNSKLGRIFVDFRLFYLESTWIRSDLLLGPSITLYIAQTFTNKRTQNSLWINSSDCFFKMHQQIHTNTTKTRNILLMRHGDKWQNSAIFECNLHVQLIVGLSDIFIYKWEPNLMQNKTKKNYEITMMICFNKLLLLRIW